MIESIQEYYAYSVVMALLVIGLYGMLLKRNLIKKIIGMSIFQSSIILFYVVSAYKITPKGAATVPVTTPSIPSTQPELYINPLPHTLMLTAIVVGVATVGVAIALTIVIYRRFETLDEAELLRKMK